MTGGRRRVLVIEDDPETADQIVDYLEARDYQTDLALNGEDGLRLASGADYAVLTIDRLLPDIDGITIIRRFERTASQPRP